MCSNVRHHVRFKSEHNWEGLYAIIYSDGESSLWVLVTFPSLFQF